MPSDCLLDELFTSGILIALIQITVIVFALGHMIYCSWVLLHTFSRHEEKS